MGFWLSLLYLRNKGITMPTPTYDLISSTTLASATSSVAFGSLPQTYRDLIVVIQAIRASGEANMAVSFNNNTTNFNRVYMYGTGSATFSGSETTRQIAFSSSEGVSNIINIMDYSATDKHKTALIRWNFAGAYVLAQATRWADNAAINTMVFTDDGGANFEAGSTFSIYGVIA